MKKEGVFFEIAYDGTGYCGWQIQPNAPTVQGSIEDALSKLNGNKPIGIVGCGRTDTGVHAKEMFAHFDYAPTLEIDSVLHKLNSYLPKDIVIYDIIPVHNEAHARFDAKKRTYNYYITSVKDVFSQEECWYYHQNLDVELMNQAAKILLNHTDFQCFSKVNTDVNTFNCTISEAHWTQENNQLIFTISADRFLRNMVRAIVGTLINVGLHKITLSEFNSIIENKNRNEAGFSVPAQGLFLTKIDYDYL